MVGSDITEAVLVAVVGIMLIEGKYRGGTPAQRAAVEIPP